ncbi:carboxypeptidase-like regulatory domain-containing protein, partial [Mycobacterium ulcerans]
MGVQWAFAQQRTITGRVIGEDGNPVPFASIRIKGSTTGTTSDADGKFLLKVQPDATLVISALGMQQKEVKVGGQTSLDILLQTSEVTLKEVIVTGAFGLKNTLRNTSYSAQVINSEQLNIIPHTDIN